MARQRRGGFRPPELRGTLGTLLRTTLAQAGGLRDVLERGAREGRARLDDALSGRRRNEALAELGEVVLELIRRGEIELDQLPEARELVEHLEALDAEHPPANNGDNDDRDVAPAPSRSRFDDRGDGTISSATWSSHAAAGAKKAVARVWRPPGTERLETDPPIAEVHTRPVPKKLGVISFAKDDDDDLADFMHPDDVPPKVK